jgi:ferredoxin-NADP reductase
LSISVTECSSRKRFLAISTGVAVPPLLSMTKRIARLSLVIPKRA